MLKTRAYRVMRQAYLFLDGDGPMVVAVVAVRMVQVPVDEVVDVVAVRDRWVSAVGPVFVVGGVTAALVFGRASPRVRAADGQPMLFHFSVRQLVMQMPVMKIIDMPLVLDRGVTAIGTVLVSVIGMHARGHSILLFGKKIVQPARPTDFLDSTNPQKSSRFLPPGRSSERLFLSMCQRIGNHFRDMAIRERVKNVLSLAALPHDPLGPQQP
jgi:hypothetical protein